MLPIARPVWTPKNVEMDGSTRAMSMARNPESRLLGLSPGHSSWASPAMPSSPNRGIRPCGNSARAQQSFAIGATSASRKARTRATISFSRSSRSSCM